MKLYQVGFHIKCKSVNTVRNDIQYQLLQTCMQQAQIENQACG